jgi:hypothetical protein
LQEKLKEKSSPLFCLDEIAQLNTEQNGQRNDSRDLVNSFHNGYVEPTSPYKRQIEKRAGEIGQQVIKGNETLKVL